MPLFFYVVLVFKIVEDAVERVVRVRRRGKEIVREAYIASSNVHNELGRAQVERHTPFRGATSDVGQSGLRCNLDFQFMPRAPVLNLATSQSSAGKPDASGRRAPKKLLTYDRAEAFYGVRSQLVKDNVMREAAYSMLASWQAAHNTDYYITKYGTKALEQLQNLIGQFAIGLRRLELEEQQERDAGNETAPAKEEDYKRRARRVTLRLAMAANRATWASCCEMALFIRTQAHVRKTYFPRDIYLSRLAYLAHTCRRLLNSEDSFLLEASELVQHGTTTLSTLSVSMSAADRKTSPLSNVVKLAASTEQEDCKHLPDADEIVLTDDDVNEDEANDAVNEDEADDGEAESEKESEKSFDDADETEKMVDADIIQMKTLRCTTSAHDDWLHRGPYLNDIPFHTYVEYFDRVRLPRRAPTEQQIFRFEAHYALSQSYGQRIRTPARIPVLEALKFVPPGETTGEENALYKLLVGALLRCTCADRCSDPLLLKPLLSRSASAVKPGKWCWRVTWKARRSELEVLAARGEEKLERSKRIPCIYDTTLCRGWLPDRDPSCTEQNDSSAMLMRATLSQFCRAHWDVMWSDAITPVLTFLNMGSTHPDQLTLAEFSALRTRRLVENLDMMSIARTVELTNKTNDGDCEHENNEANDGKERRAALRCEFVGGEHDLEEDSVIHEEEIGHTARHPLTLEAATTLLRRDAEIAAAKKPGRHREGDVQMKSFVDKFGSVLDKTLPPISSQYAEVSPKLLGRNERQALDHQRAVRTAMKKDQEDLQDTVATPAAQNEQAAILAALKNLQLQEAQETFVIVELPDIRRGPKHVAELIMADQRPHGRILNEEQTLLFALWVDILETAFLSRPNPEEPYLALDTWLLDIVVDGGGGCGKTMLINYFLVPLCRAFFRHKGVVLAAPSNKAARGIGAKTLHSLLGFTPEMSLRTAALALTTQKRVKLERTFVGAGAFFVDEHSMLAGSMNHAASLLATYAREMKYRLRRENYALPCERFGRLPALAYFGDHLQLPPVPKANAMLAPLEHTSQEHRVGAAIFRQVKYVFHLQQMMRFTDPILIRILTSMRTVGGKPLPDSDWNALLRTEFDSSSSSAEKPDITGWYHTCYVWSVITMAAFMVARESARTAQKTLFYIQAVDNALNVVGHRNIGTQQLYHAFLQVSSLTKTKRLPAFCLLHVGMEVRLTTTLEMPYAVQDATGTVLDIHEADNGAEANQHRRKVPGLESFQPEILLDALPVAVLVKLHDCQHVFLPVQPCAECTIFNQACSACMANRKKLEGVFAVEPLPRIWKYEGPELEGQFINVKRVQIPLAPAKVLPLYSMQGMTASPGLVAHWVIPPRLSSDIKWLICYVTLSRVRSLKTLLSIGLSDKIRSILEGGPPEGLVQMFSTLFAEKIESTQRAALRAKNRLGW